MNPYAPPTVDCRPEREASVPARGWDADFLASAILCIVAWPMVLAILYHDRLRECRWRRVANAIPWVGMLATVAWICATAAVMGWFSIIVREAFR